MGILGLFKPNVRRMKAKKDVEGLIKALNYERDHDVRMGAAEALGEIGDKRAVEPLFQALEDVNTEWLALGALREMRTFGKLGEGALRKLKKWDGIIV